MTAEELVRGGDVAGALEALQKRVKAAPTDAKLRVFLFQLLAILGQWDRALTQLHVASDLDAENLLMAQVCQQAIQCEALRKEIFAGQRAPLVLGEPPEWLGWLIQAAAYTGRGEHAAGQELRAKAFDAAPETPGAINGAKFAWIADADQRLGPVLEVLLDGKYYWVPFANIKEISLDAPSDLRDLVWAPARFTWINGGTAVGFVPTRYPGTEQTEQGALLLARKTDWRDLPEGLATCVGQRLFATDVDNYPLLETRKIEFACSPSGA